MVYQLKFPICPYLKQGTKNCTHKCITKCIYEKCPAKCELYVYWLKQLKGDFEAVEKPDWAIPDVDSEELNDLEEID